MTTTHTRSTSIHLFAGAGGDMQAAERAGVQPVIGCNHWTRAVETHSVFGAELFLGDLSVADPRALPHGNANILYASCECDGWSSARNHDQATKALGPWDPNSGIGRSRCTAFCPFRFVSAIPSIEIVILENVVEMATRYPSAFADWCDEWDKLGFNLQLVNANSAFFGLAQSRDRLYMVATRKGAPVPDLEFRPAGWCFECERTVHGVQTWKPQTLARATPAGPVGKYGPRNQYIYRCPTCSTDTRPVMIYPYIQPAWTIIDWTIEAQRIGDRDKPLAPKTMDRIRAGLDRVLADQLVPLDRLTYAKRTRDVWLPAPVLTGRQDIALVRPPFGAQITLRNNVQGSSFDQPSQSVCGSGNHLGLVVSNMENNLARRADRDPAHTVTSGNKLGVLGGDAVEMLVAVAGNTYERPGSGYARAWSTQHPAVTVHGTLDRAVVQTPPVLAGEGYAVANFGGNGNGHVRDVTNAPTGTQTAGGQTAVVRVPAQAMISSYYGGSDVNASVTQDPVGTVTGTDRHALIDPQPGTRDFDLEDATFRMLTPEECQATMGMTHRIRPTDEGYVAERYELVGSKRDRVRLAGNAICPDVEAAITERCLDAFGY